jgi:hypothetical protein
MLKVSLVLALILLIIVGVVLRQRMTGVSAQDAQQSIDQEFLASNSEPDLYRLEVATSGRQGNYHLVLHVDPDVSGTLYKPDYDYTVHMMFFDRSGNRVRPRRRIAVTLPEPNKFSFREITAGGRLSGTISRRMIDQLWEVPSHVALVVFCYEPADFVRQWAEEQDLDLLAPKVYSRSVSWE